MNKTAGRNVLLLLLVCVCAVQAVGLAEEDFAHGRLTSIAIDGKPLPGFDAELDIALYGTTVPDYTGGFLLTLTAVPGTLGAPLIQDKCAVTLNEGEPIAAFAPAEEEKDGTLLFEETFDITDDENTLVIHLESADGATEYTLLVMRAAPETAGEEQAEQPETSGGVTYRTLPPWATPHPPEFDKNIAMVGNTKGSATVYSGPGTANTPLGTVTDGEEIKINRWDGAWCEVFYNNNSNIGWLHTRYIVLWAD